MIKKLKALFKTWLYKRPEHLGGMAPKEDPRDYIYAAAVPLDIKKVAGITELDEWSIPYNPAEVYDQGATPMCVAYSIKRLKEIQEYNDQKEDLDISPGFIYLNRIKSDFSYMMNAGGMIIREALSHLIKEGTVTNDEFEWYGNWKHLSREDQVAIAERRWTELPKGIWEQALPNRIIQYTKLLTDEADLAGGQVKFTFSEKQTAAEYYDSLCNFQFEEKIERGLF